MVQKKGESDEITYRSMEFLYKKGAGSDLWLSTGRLDRLGTMN